MRPPIKINDSGVFGVAFRHELPVSFTADAINQLSLSEQPLFDIKDWVWHTEIINGVQYCIITERLQHPPAPNNGEQ